MEPYHSVDDGLLIQIIKKYDLIYNKRNVQHKNKPMVEFAWRAVAAHMKLNVKTCQQHWLNLRQRFAKERRNLPHGSPEESTWMHYKSLMFLDNIVKRRSVSIRTSNLPLGNGQNYKIYIPSDVDDMTQDSVADVFSNASASPAILPGSSTSTPPIVIEQTTYAISEDSVEFDIKPTDLVTGETLSIPHGAPENDDIIESTNPEYCEDKTQKPEKCQKKWQEEMYKMTLQRMKEKHAHKKRLEELEYETAKKRHAFEMEMLKLDIEIKKRKLQAINNTIDCL